MPEAAHLECAHGLPYVAADVGIAHETQQAVAYIFPVVGGYLRFHYPSKTTQSRNSVPSRRLYRNILLATRKTQIHTGGAHRQSILQTIIRYQRRVIAR